MDYQIPIRDKSDLLKLRPFDLPLYDRYALTSLTAYTIFWLHEWNITTTLENLAVASYRMFPVKFCLVGWPQFPDINRTNRSVLQMRPKYRNLATSASGKGVFLNHNGVQEAMSLIEKLGPPLFEGELPSVSPVSPLRAERGRSGKPRSVHPEDLLTAVHNSQLFALYSQSRFDEAEAIHLIGLLNVYDHTPSSEKRRKLKALVDASREVGDESIKEFLNQVSKRFSRYLNK
jgi:hypothetical protein